MNEYMYRQQDYLGQIALSLKEKHLTIPGSEKIPDGMLRILKASKKEFNVAL